VVVKNFKDLAVYQRAESLADELRRSTSAWEQFDRWTVGVQMLRAADSVGANIAEGWGRDTRRDRRRFLFLARGSSCELEHWIRRADARLLPVPRGAGDRVEEVSRMLNGLLRAWS
jgi:four helix bundle protein